MTDNSPYLGLRPFQEKEQAKFFGRLPEIHILTDKILAHRVTLLVAASGVGKSSLLQAGVMPALRATGLADLVYHNDWALNPAEALKKTIVAHFIAQQRVNADYQADFSLPLPEFLQLHALLGTGTLVVLLDQFEEFFYYQRFSQQRDEFIRQLAGAIQDTDTPTAFVFSMREDFAMEMEAFKPWFAGIFSNIYRIEKLGLNAARQAIEGPVQAAGFTYQADLLDKLLTDLGQRERNMRLDLQPIDGQDLTPPLVEPPYLQIVCQQLWLKASASTEREITIQHYQQLGAADGILARHFDGKMATLNAGQRRLASRAFDLLVSQHGAKMSYPLDELAKLLNQDKAALQETLEELQNAAILRRVLRQGHPWYELYHDIFAKHIVAWNQTYKQKQLQRQLLIRGGLAVLAGVAVWVAYDGGMNYHTRHFRLGKETVSERVELYQGQSGSRDMLHDIFQQQKFIYESDYELSDIEADKRFETAAIAEREQTAVMQIGQLPLAHRYTAYAELGLFANADKVFDAIHKAEDKNLIFNLATQLSTTRVKKTIGRLQALMKGDASLQRTVILGLTHLKVQATIQPLLELLINADNNGRDDVIEALTDLKSQDVIQPLLLLLNDVNPEVSEAVIKVLGELKAQAAIQSLLPFLNDCNHYVCLAAITALDNLKAEDAIQPLLHLLNVEYVDVRYAAIEALGNLKAEEAIQPLLPLLNVEDADVRFVAIKALRNLKAEDAIQPLLDLAKNNDDDARVRLNAIWALDKIKPQDAIQPLLALLKDDEPKVRSEASQVLALLSIQSLLAVLNVKDADVCKTAIVALGNLKAEEAIQPLLALAKNDAKVLWTAIQALVKIKPQHAIQILLGLLNNPNTDVRSNAIETLGNLKAEEAIQPLLDLLKNDVPNVRISAARVLGDLNAQDAIQPLLNLLNVNEDPEVRQHAVWALGDLNAQDAIQPLLVLLNDPDVRYASIVVLAKLNAQDAIQPLMALLSVKDDSNVREAAINALGELNAQEAIQPLLALIKNDTDVSWAAIQALAKINPQYAIQPLLDLLKNNDPNVRIDAIQLLANKKAQSAIQTLLDLLKDNDGNVGQAAINALKQMKVLMMSSDEETKTTANDLITQLKDVNLSTQQRLKEIATDTSSHEHLRLAAVDALGGTGRPEIATLLFGLLQDKNQATLHFAIVFWLAKMPELADKKAVLSVLQQRLAGLEQDKANWRGLRDAYKTGQSEHEKPIVCYDPALDNSGLTRWCDDYKIYQYAYAIAMQDPENAGITLLNHPSYQARAAAVRALAEKASGELLQKLLAYYKAFDWQDLPSPRPYTTYRAIDKVLAQLENGSEHDLKMLQDLKTQLDIPANSENPTDQEQQQDALIQRFDWTIDELTYRVQQKITTLQPTNAR